MKKILLVIVGLLIVNNAFANVCRVDNRLLGASSATLEDIQGVPFFGNARLVLDRRSVEVIRASILSGPEFNVNINTLRVAHCEGNCRGSIIVNPGNDTIFLCGRRGDHDALSLLPPIAIYRESNDWSIAHNPCGAGTRLQIETSGTPLHNGFVGYPIGTKPRCVGANTTSSQSSSVTISGVGTITVPAGEQILREAEMRACRESGGAWNISVTSTGNECVCNSANGKRRHPSENRCVNITNPNSAVSPVVVPVVAPSTGWTDVSCHARGERYARYTGGGTNQCTCAPDRVTQNWSRPYSGGKLFTSAVANQQGTWCYTMAEICNTMNPRPSQVWDTARSAANALTAVTCPGSEPVPPEQPIPQSIVDLVALRRAVDNAGDSRAYRHADGTFNWLRLGVNLGGAAIVGTAAGVLTNRLVANSQINKGQESIQCIYGGGGKTTAYGTTFMIE